MHMKSDHNQKNPSYPLLVSLTFLLLLAIILVPLLIPHGRSQDIYAGWAESKDPCFPVKQMKKYWREHYNMEADFLQCVPLEVMVEWDIEENYIRHPGAGDDRVKLLLQDEFTAYLELTYDQENLKRLEAFNIIGPSPCCPGEVNADLLQIDASMLACYGAENCRHFTTSDPLMFQVIPQTDNFFSFTWGEEMRNRSGGFGSSQVKLHPSALPPSLSTRRGIGGILHGSHFQINLNGEDSITWDEIQTGLERGEFLWKFPIDKKERVPGNHFYSQEGEALVIIKFGEEEIETWRIRVEGWEKDTTQPPITYQDPSGALKSLPVAVDFQCLLEGQFQIGKRKKTRAYKGGHITQGGIMPRLIFENRELYRCELVDCQDQTDTTMLEGTIIDGTIIDSSVRLDWRIPAPAACVLCNPRVSYIQKTPYRRQFNAREIIRRISQETLPLRDGYTVTREEGDWLHYKITLTKLN
jgi:hypothetical protein